LPKSVFCPRLFQASAAPRPENSNSGKKDALFGLDTQITIFLLDANTYLLVHEKAEKLTRSEKIEDSNNRKTTR
jgi:hypothetical protein